MARRKRKSTPSTRSTIWLVHGLLLCTGLAAGYVWRSYAPLPLPGGSALSGDTPSRVDPEELSRRAEAKKERLREELDDLREKQEQTEEDLAEIQIKEILGGKM